MDQKATPPGLYDRDLERRPANFVPLSPLSFLARAALVYPDKIAVSDASMAEIDLRPHEWHGEWNYTIRPRPALTISPDP